MIAFNPTLSEQRLMFYPSRMAMSVFPKMIMASDITRTVVLQIWNVWQTLRGATALKQRIWTTHLILIRSILLSWRVKSKDSTFDKNPYSLYYQRFSHDAMRANKIYVIGYSFSDAHFNRMILNFLNVSPENTIYIVDYFPNHLDVVQEFTTPGSLISRIFRALNISSIPMVGHPPNPTYQYQNHINSLNGQGYGFIMPQVWFYKKGYDQFLSEINVLP